MEKHFFTSYSSSEIADLIRNCVKAELQNYLPCVPAQSDDMLLTAKEACAFLKTTSTTLRKYRKEGSIKTDWHGTRPRFKKSELLKSVQNDKKYSRR